MKKIFYNNESYIFLKRISISIVFFIILFLILIINLYHLQVLCFKNYQMKSERNHVKNFIYMPERGKIYDKNGKLLTQNKNLYKLQILRNDSKNINLTIKKLKKIINITELELKEFNKKFKKSRNFDYITIKKMNNVDIARFSINKYKFLEMKIKNYKYRYYPYGSSLTHLLGYASKINKHDLKKINEDNKSNEYMNFDNFGKLGIEKYYEYILHGKYGFKKFNINNKGKILNKIKEYQAISGKDIYLTIDVNLQKYIKKLLKGTRSAVIVSNAKDGSILAMVSNPSYDPNVFVNGISYKDFNLLKNDPDYPLLNRATQGLYPPASTIKPYIAISALSINLIDSNTTLYDPGWWKIPGTNKSFKDWKKNGHGLSNIKKAIEESIDTFFYQIAYKMGIDNIYTWMKKFGYGEKTGIDIFEESVGNLPNKEWKYNKFKKPWYIGDTISIGIGQGYLTTTIIQINKSLLTLINNGNIIIPHVLHNNNINFESYNKYNELKNVNKNFWKLVKYGMYSSANHPNGTTYDLFGSSKYKIASKSGTAQVFHIKDNKSYDSSKISERLRDHKLMIAYAPYDKPEIAISIILENGGKSYNSIGYIVKKIFDFLLL